MLKAKVTDAGDAVSGATVSAKGHSKTTSAKGAAKLTISGSEATTSPSPSPIPAIAPSR